MRGKGRGLCHTEVRGQEEAATDDEKTRQRR